MSAEGSTARCGAGVGIGTLAPSSGGSKSPQARALWSSCAQSVRLKRPQLGRREARDLRRDLLQHSGPVPSEQGAVFGQHSAPGTTDRFTSASEASTTAENFTLPPTCQMWSGYRRITSNSVSPDIHCHHGQQLATTANGVTTIAAAGSYCLHNKVLYQSILKRNSGHGWTEISF